MDRRFARLLLAMLALEVIVAASLLLGPAGPGSTVTAAAIRHVGAGHAGHTNPLASPLRAGQAQNVPPLLGNLGSHQHPITTESALAQRYFDEGLILTYGFNHAEAIRSFRDAAALDPTCAMCY